MPDDMANSNLLIRHMKASRRLACDRFTAAY
jgi:hypothetical protein